ncbi:MAG: hypothetical protein CL521_03010 [Actinobacteria bacterium]|nr:hypothetical protein [Actinomycetota bacterium]
MVLKNYRLIFVFLRSDWARAMMKVAMDWPFGDTQNRAFKQDVKNHMFKSDYSGVLLPIGSK